MEPLMGERKPQSPSCLEVPATWHLTCSSRQFLKQAFPGDVHSPVMSGSVLLHRYPGRLFWGIGLFSYPLLWGGVDLEALVTVEFYLSQPRTLRVFSLSLFLLVSSF